MENLKCKKYQLGSPKNYLRGKKGGAPESVTNYVRKVWEKGEREGAYPAKAKKEGE